MTIYIWIEVIDKQTETYFIESYAAREDVESLLKMFRLTAHKDFRMCFGRLASRNESFEWMPSTEEGLKKITKKLSEVILPFDMIRVFSSCQKDEKKISKKNFVKYKNLLKELVSAWRKSSDKEIAAEAEECIDRFLAMGVYGEGMKAMK